MPAGYTITTITVNDREKYREYARHAFATMEKHQCEVLVDESDPQLLEGEWTGRRTIVLKWPSRQAALDWYNSPEYQAIVDLRFAAAETNLVVVSGLQ